MQNFYATDPKNIVNFEIGNKSATCDPAATKTSKVKDTLLYNKFTCLSVLLFGMDGCLNGWADFIIFWLVIALGSGMV